ncbi:MAG: TerB family tellurite resistance protein [Candidatus Poseidoniaceae archaeon]|nr:TerB family tellurite resistance protein [Candidatus Poseidoniaceae archaeon]
MSGENVGALSVFRTTTEVMLRDGVLTREEKRLIIKLANSLGLTKEEPAEVYSAIKEGRETETGREVTPNEQELVYTSVFEVAIVNASLSKDEFAVLAHLRDQFNIDDEKHTRIEANLRDMIRQRTEDENVVDKLLGTLKDSVSLVGSLFDSVRTKSV